MLRATRRAVKAAPHLADPRFAGGVAALEALARLIDEAGPGEERGRIVVRAVPHYLAASNELLLTPRSVPALTRPPAPAPATGSPAKETPKGAKVTKFAEAAARRRANAAAAAAG